MFLDGFFEKEFQLLQTKSFLLFVEEWLSGGLHARYIWWLI